MPQYLPLTASAQNLLAQVNAAREVVDIPSDYLIQQVGNNEITLPTKLEELDRETVDIIDLSVDTAAALKIPFGAADHKFSRRIFIQEYKKYKEITDGTDTIHCGIGIRWIVNIKKINASADISSLPMVTASAQLNSLSATVRFEVVGISSPAITKLLPSNVDLKADTYVELKNAFEQIKSNIWNNTTTITPTILGIFGTIKEKEDQKYQDAVAIYYALQKIKDGKILQRALSELKHKKETFKEIVIDVYKEINKSSELLEKISSSAKERANDLLER